MRVSFVECPEGLNAGNAEWSVFAGHVRQQAPEVLVTNEMPFGRWLAGVPTYDAAAAAESVTAHDAGVSALAELGVPTVLSSRPVACGERLANEGFALHGAYRRAHHKQYFPEEPGFYEASWYQSGMPGFDVLEVGELRVGFQLCSEIMFNEWSRHYRRQGAQLIVVPRASEATHRVWMTAAAMAAIVSGCYVISSNRVGPLGDGMAFGGRGFAMAPNGELIAETSPDNPVVTIEMDLDAVRRQQTCYPNYVDELEA